MRTEAEELDEATASRGAAPTHATSAPWQAVAHALGELVDVPVLVLGESQVVAFANDRAAALLGADREALEGSSFVSAFVTPQAATPTSAAIERAASGSGGTFQVPVASRDGRLLSLMVDVRAAGSGVTCLLVRAHCEIEAQKSAEPAPDVAFELSTEPASWGTVTRVFGRSEGHSFLRPGVRCYEAVGHSEPPPDCPVIAWANGGGEARAVSSTCVPGHVLVANVERSGPASVLVSGRLVALAVLGTLADARIGELCARGNLSKREREVLVELVKSGDSLELIAQRLGIRTATVKFHAANLLQKLGADSRIDLFRLLF